MNRHTPSRLALLACFALAACGNPDATSAQESDPPFNAQNRIAPSDASEMRVSFAPVVRSAAPAVVNIAARRVERQRDPFWEFFGGGVPQTRLAESVGSGVIVRSDGIVVTNHHVVDRAQQIRVVLADRREFPARVILSDPRSDLAVLQVETGGERLPVLPIDETEDQQVGDLVLAIGNPFGVGQTVTNGIISALNRTETGITDASSFIQTDAAINPGNSGGALVDMDGRLIGINTAIFSRSGTSSGVGFAVPASMVRRVVESATGGASSVVRPWLGARTTAVTADAARSLGLSRPQGVIVTDLYPGGPAARAGLREGDIITAIDGAEVNDPGGLNFRIGTRRPGDTTRVAILRGGSAQTLDVRVDEPPATPAREQRVIEGRNPLSGAQVVNLSPAVADELGLDPLIGEGVLITAVSGRGSAASVGFRPGDIVRQVNGQRVTTTRQLEQLLSAQQGWAITIERNGQLITGRWG